MQISVSGHHIQITQSIEAYIHKKLSRLERHFQPILSSQVILTVDKNTQKAESRVHISGTEVFAEAESDNLYTSIDKMTKKLDRRIVEVKRKLISRRHVQTAFTE